MYWPYLLLPVIGAGFALVFAPLQWTALLLPLLITSQWLFHRIERPLLGGWLFGIGFFATGISWVFSAMRVSQTGIVLSVVLTGLFVLALAVLFSLQFLLANKINRHLNTSIGFAASWLLFEWLREWLFTGLPWLFLGYSQTAAWLQGWLPVVGVIGTSAIILWTAHGFYLFITSRRWAIAASALILLALAAPLRQIEWSQAIGEAQVGLVQNNIDQQTKWRPSNVQRNVDINESLSRQVYQADLIVWPETAITATQWQARGYLAGLDERMAHRDIALIAGLPMVEDESLYNSVIGVGLAQGHYDKQRLVPFGEFMPFEAQLRGIIDFFDLPMSDFTRGSRDQTAISWQLAGNQYNLSPLICYEVAYASTARHGIDDNTPLLVTVSNDAWFGRSLGPHQHRQIAIARGIENARWIVRATQSGQSFIANEWGETQLTLPSFEATAASGQVTLRSGQTLYNQFGHGWMIGALLAGLALRLIWLRWCIRA